VSRGQHGGSEIHPNFFLQSHYSLSNDFGERNLDESPFLLSHYAGWFLILRALFAGGVDCNFLYVLIMDHLEIQIALNLEVSEKYACKEDVYFNLMCCTH
jgi:hypothetical protein